MIDLRSDTVTKPTKDMLHAMMQAPVGDDVFEEDPSVNAFQQKMAHMFGFQAALFMPSGVMGNQVALKLLTNPGDEVIIEKKGHVFNYETTSAALISSIQLHSVQGSNGKLNGDLIRSAVRSGQDWEPLSKVVVIENSTNKGGGACYSKDELSNIKETVDGLGLSLHLDGARIWNAIETTGIAADYFGSIADTMTISFSKGLGAPAGSMLLASKERINEGRRIRKMLGGGMRQIGLLAAAADYAVEHHRSFLKEDHHRARVLAETISGCERLSINLDTVETNILIFDVLEGSASEAVKLLKEKGVQVVPFGPKTLRATFHFQVDDEDLHYAQEVFIELFD
ncbi:MAG: aminotransferase class I/II-fold pyridoxal phosphate-dependent enzyme [Balneolaceae bacterium]|nr:aminotransferase class I/II-fold pyridoxal phosphate-dependent enzyme [Balneolaceae bacterium]